MHCVVTAGPTWEPLDKVRRLTNFSTGRLGTELAQFLVERGHEVTLLRGDQATYTGPCRVRDLRSFSTTADLQRQLADLAGSSLGAVFHAAAVSDFAVGQIWRKGEAGWELPAGLGKLPSRADSLLVELVPTPKVIGFLRGWFPGAVLVGWKYEVDGDRKTVLDRARAQVEENRLNACVANGPAYGEGYGLVQAEGPDRPCPDAPGLFAALAALLDAPTVPPG